MPCVPPPPLGSATAHCTVPNVITSLTANTTRLPNVTPYNTFSLTCTATTSVEGVGNVALPKKFLWMRRYGSSELNLNLLSSNATIQIQGGDSLNQHTSMMTVNEDIPRDYRYRCRVDLNLTADMILNSTDIYPIIITGKTSKSSVYLPHDILKKVSNLALVCHSLCWVLFHLLV